MNKRKPTIITQLVKDNSAQLTLRVDADIDYFQGHFASYPILPGVTQVEWAVHYGKALLNTPTEFGGMEVIKFQDPILPDSIIELNLSWSAEKGKLHFSYRSPEEDSDEVGVYSSGRIKLDVAQ